MNKCVKRIIANVTLLGIFAMYSPVEYINLFGTSEVYGISRPYLKKIYVDNGYDINFSYLTYAYSLKVSKTLEEITIKARAEKATDIVRINGVVVNKENKYKQTVKLDKKLNKVEIEVEDGTNSKNITTYTIYISKGYITPADNLNENNNANEVFLDNIVLDDEEIGFKKRTYTYNMKIDEDQEVFRLNIEPEYETDIIKVNGTKLENTTIATLGLRTKGKYVITVVVEDSVTNKRGTYTLNLYKGMDMPEKPVEIPAQPPKADQWVKVKGKWQYNDSLGEPLKDVWFFDYYYNSYFYLDSDGNMKTGWLKKDGQWYYLDENGAMKTGWIYKNKHWYYLNTDGSMNTGWLNWNDKWYYFNEDGSMMKLGWLFDNNNWYLIQGNGEMLHDNFFEYKGDFYYLSEDGSMQTEEKEINGYLFDFNEDGSVVNVRNILLKI